MTIPAGYTEIRVLSYNMIEAWYQCEDPRFPCPTGNQEWEEFSRTSGPMGSHGGCSDCLMTGIVWIKIEPLKWKCSGSPDYTCTQAIDGIYTTEAECLLSCTYTPSENGNILPIIGIGLLIGYFLTKGKT